MACVSAWPSLSKAVQILAKRLFSGNTLLSAGTCWAKALPGLTYTFKYGYLDEAMVLEAIANRPPMQHVVITGRGASEGLKGAADTVTELMDVKHAWRAGIKAQAGIDL